MVTSTSRLAYQDCYDLMDRALSNKKGIRVRAKDFNHANNLRMRIHAARTIDRMDNLKDYEDGHPLHGRSAYDPLMVRIDSQHDKTWLKIEKNSIDNLEIEPLGEEEHVIDKTTDGDSGEAPGTGLDKSGEGPSEAGGEESFGSLTEEGEEIKGAEEVKAAALRRI